MTSELPAALPVDRLRQKCDPEAVSRHTKAPARDGGLIGQDRGLGALHLAVEIRHSDFNLFVLGPQGTGRHSAVETILREHSATRAAPEDWAYVNNFDDPQKPVALRLPSGTADRLKEEMADVVDDLANDIPALFESEEYQTQRRAIDAEFGERQEKAMADFTERARAEDIALIKTPMGFMVAATRDGQVVKTEEFRKLPETEQAEIEEKIARFQEELSHVLENVPKLEREHRVRIEALNAEMAERAVSGRIDEARGALEKRKEIADFLTRVQDDMIENPELFLQAAAQQTSGPFPEALGRRILRRCSAVTW